MAKKRLIAITHSFIAAATAVTYTFKHKQNIRIIRLSGHDQDKAFVLIRFLYLDENGDAHNFCGGYSTGTRPANFIGEMYAMKGVTIDYKGCDVGDTLTASMLFEVLD